MRIKLFSSYVFQADCVPEGGSKFLIQIFIGVFYYKCLRLFVEVILRYSEKMRFSRCYHGVLVLLFLTLKRLPGVRTDPTK